MISFHSLLSALALTLTALASPAWAAMDLKNIVQKINARNCAATLGDPAPKLLLVVGLGNLGYDGTRHNTGDEIVGRLEKAIGTESEIAPELWLTHIANTAEEAIEYERFSGASNPKREGLNVHYRVGGRVAIAPAGSAFSNVVFVHPYYDINESGHFVSALAKELKLPAEQILVVFDDITLPRGQVVLGQGKAEGNADGHNGLKSINEMLGSGAYHRVRMGISKPSAEKLNVSLTDWVLGKTPEADANVLYSETRLALLKELIANFQQRLVPGARVDQVKGQAGKIIKKINQ